MRLKVKVSYEILLQRIELIEKIALLKINANLNNIFTAEAEKDKEYVKGIQYLTMEYERLLPPASCTVERASLVREVTSRSFVIQRSKLLQNYWKNYFINIAAMIKHSAEFTATFIPPTVSLVRS